ncbi:ammonium transporter [Anaerobaca lacustris]|uniref:Ammonium transporter n=1 Tax=Anaerobaca lacustris TaxID=3044600 RepID=A0AAW6TZF5_9BACT|nr:ammonium transporter [Sedimentisphaerales bacterium M17dextr]
MRLFGMLLTLFVLVLPITAGAADETAASAVEVAKDELQTNINIVWTCIAAFLVFFMQAGFAMVETGFTRAKNAVNILMKNLMDFSVGSIAFFLVGFGLMFGQTNGFFGTTLFGLSGVEPGGDWNWTFLIFQTVFAATAATIVSGAMAERTKFTGYLAYSFFITLFIYPIFGSWAWGGLLDGGGWLEKLGFLDFAGSTVVHSVGGWLALAGAVVLGPRVGKYGPDGKPRAILGHNLPLAALGVFILWFGWFGFNPGSTTTGDGSIGYIAVTTNLSAAAGAIVAMATAWVLLKKPDASMALNGALAGLVAITAPCDGVSPMGAILIGAVGGVLVVLSVLFIDHVLKVDDPVGAVSVHGVCGAWGTLSAGLFNLESGLFYGGGLGQLGVQALGVVTAFAWAFGLGLGLFYLIKVTIGLRVSEEEEQKGLDIGEHGMEAYAGFQIFTTS